MKFEVSNDVDKCHKKIRVTGGFMYEDKACPTKVYGKANLPLLSIIFVAWTCRLCLLSSQPLQFTVFLNKPNQFSPTPNISPKVK